MDVSFGKPPFGSPQMPAANSILLCDSLLVPVVGCSLSRGAMNFHRGHCISSSERQILFILSQKYNSYGARLPF